MFNICLFFRKDPTQRMTTEALEEMEAHEKTLREQWLSRAMEAGIAVALHEARTCLSNLKKFGEPESSYGADADAENLRIRKDDREVIEYYATLKYLPDVIKDLEKKEETEKKQSQKLSQWVEAKPAPQTDNASEMTGLLSMRQKK